MRTGLTNALTRKANQLQQKGEMYARTGLAAFKGKEAGQVSIERLQGYAIAFVVIGVVLTVGLRVLGGVKEQINSSTAAEGATNAIQGLTTFTDWLPIIALVVVSAIIIGLVSMFRSNGGNRGMA